LSLNLTPEGYPSVGVFDPSGVRRTRLVHRLVAEAFHGAADGRVVNHRNGDRRDNRPDNLEWVTQRENVRHGTRVLGKNRGSGHWKARLTEEAVGSIRSRWKLGEKRAALAREFGVSVEAVNRVVYRKKDSWAHVA
jgi:hypothetical protein